MKPFRRIRLSVKDASEDLLPGERPQYRMAMSESLTDRTEPQSRRGAGEARFGAKSLMQDKASRLSKWLCDPKRAYAAHIRRLDTAE